MKRILVLIPYYKPGYRSGGPQRTLENIIDAYGTNIKIYIYTQNYDLGEKLPYEGVEINKWVKVDNAYVMYSRKEDYCGKSLKSLYKKFDVIYSCGLFEINSIRLLILHRKMHLTGKEIVIAPMGVFSEGAINSKALKKKAFLKLFLSLGMFKGVVWSFTSEMERRDAIKQLGKNNVSRYVIAEDLPRKINKKHDLSPKKDLNLFKIVFLSRICSQKNLDYALRILNSKELGNIDFSIYGVCEDMKYWDVCQNLIKGLPSNISVSYKGEVKPDEVLDVFSKNDIFLFPTKGENFGHVIYESLSVGCIPIISDQTPWQNLEEKKCGFVCKLSEIESFRRAIMQSKENVDNFNQLKKNAVSYAEKKYTESIKKSGYRKLFMDELL